VAVPPPRPADAVSRFIALAVRVRTLRAWRSPLQLAAYPGRNGFVLFIDIDEFKSINDSYGHDLGDKVLLMVANRLQSFLREQDTVSRWGGDEFVCLLLEVKQEADLSRLADKLLSRIAEAYEFNVT